jgi:hypothetical protein
MNWDTLKLIWKRLAKQFGFPRGRSDDYRDRRISQTLTETSISDRWSIGHATPYHPDFSEKRHEFSQHTGC